VFGVDVKPMKCASRWSATGSVVAALVVWLSVSVNADPYFEDLEAALQAGNERDVNVLIKFHEAQCGWCDHIDTTVLVDPKAQQFFTEEMVLVKVYSESDTDIVNRYSVTTSPTMVLVRPNGEEIDRITSYMPVDRFLSTLRSYDRGIGTLGNMLSRAEGSDNRTLMMQIAEKYKLRGDGERSNAWYQKVVTAGDPADQMSGEARIHLADAKRRAREWDAALADFKAIEEDFQGHQFAATAAIWQAMIYQERGDTEAAIAEYERFIADYPKAKETDYARKQISKLKSVPIENGKS